MKAARSTPFGFIGRISLVCAVLAVALLAPTGADAAPLVVGQTQFPVANENGDPSGGTDLVGFPPLTAPFVGFGFTGTLTSRVITGDANNPGGLTFTYQLTNNAGSAHVLHRLTIGSFSGPLGTSSTDVSYQTGNAAHVAPTLADRSTADVIGFSFADVIPGVAQTMGNIPPGGSSKLLVIQTNAIAAAQSFASVINGTVATAATYAPVTQIPEPSTCVLGAVGLIGLVGLARRIRK